MNRKTGSRLVIILLVVLALVAGCTSGPGKESPAGAKAISPSPVHTSVEMVATPDPVRATETAAEAQPPGTTEHTFGYVLNGVKGSVSVPLSDSLYAEYAKKPDPVYNRPYDARTNTTYYLAYMNDAAQQPAIVALAQAIRQKTPDADDQARIAVSLVQHIPYKEGGKQYRYPYEVLYKNQGVCGEKSMLLAVLLKELGFGSSVFYFLPEDHMVTGVRASSPYDFRDSGYAFIEATEPFIITDSTTDNLAQWKFTSTMEVTPVGTGQALASIATDAGDARQWAVLEAKVKSLSPSERQEWQALDTKYDLSYYT